MKNLPYWEGIGPFTHTLKPDDAFSIAIYTITLEFLKEPSQISSDKSRGGGGTSWINPRKYMEGMKDGGPPSWSWTSKKQANTLSMIKAGILGRDSCACEERSVKWVEKRPHPTRCVEDWRSQESGWRGPQLKEITSAKTTALCTLLVNSWWRVWWHVVVFALWGFQSSSPSVSDGFQMAGDMRTPPMSLTELIWSRLGPGWLHPQELVNVNSPQWVLIKCQHSSWWIWHSGVLLY